MKVFVDANVIINAFTRADESQDSLALLEKLRDDPGFSLWASALSAIYIEQEVSKLSGADQARQALDTFLKWFCIVPLRRSALLKAVNDLNPGFANAAQLAGAEEMNLDCIIAADKDHFRGNRISVLTPSEFLEKLNAGEFARVNQVPFMDLTAQHGKVYNEIDDRFTAIAARTGFILGPYVSAFEKDFALAHEARYCLGVSTGTDALHLALMALDIGPGDRVALPVNTFIATAEAVTLCGAEPVFVDCDEKFNLDPQKLEKTLEEDSGTIKAVIPVHLYGRPADMDAITELAKKFQIQVVEDCCQAHLARSKDKVVGNFGVFGAFSFYPGKNLGAWGEGGALICNDEEMHQKALMLSRHGEIKRYHHQVAGHNYRMEALQGAVLGAKLPYLQAWTEARIENAGLYTRLLEGMGEVRTPEKCAENYCVYHLYVIRAKNRDRLQQHLQEKGISSGLHYPVPLHMQKAYASLGYKPGDFPVAESAAAEILSLPMYPELSKDQIRYVVEQIKDFYV